MELNETIEMMQSSDYKERFKAEYYQLKIRYEKLEDMLVKYSAGTLEFEPSCSYTILTEQFNFMRAYLHVLKVRANIEGIEL